MLYGDFLVGILRKINAHLPMFNVSDRMKEPIIITRTTLRGLKAVTKTGPLSFITPS